MIDELQILLHIESGYKIKTLHNEFKIIYYLMQNEKLSSLDLLRKTGRSISGHNNDLRRLTSLKVIEHATSEDDKRVKFYSLTPKFKKLFKNIGESDAPRVRETMAAE